MTKLFWLLYTVLISFKLQIYCFLYCFVLSWKGSPREGLNLKETSKDHLVLGAQDHVQMAFEYPQGWRLHHLSGKPMPVLAPFKVKRCFLLLRGNHLCFSWSPLLLVLPQPKGKELDLSSLYSLFGQLFSIISSKGVLCNSQFSIVLQL